MKTAKSSPSAQHHTWVNSPEPDGVVASQTFQQTWATTPDVTSFSTPYPTTQQVITSTDMRDVPTDVPTDDESADEVAPEVTTEPVRRLLVSSIGGCNPPPIGGRTLPPPSSQKPCIAIIGDSMIKNISSYNIRSIVKNIDCYVRPNLGAEVDDMIEKLRPDIKKRQTDVVILHVGVNDCRSKDFDLRETIRRYECLIDFLESEGVIVIVSLNIFLIVIF